MRLRCLPQTLQDHRVFNNDWQGFAVLNAFELTELLGSGRVAPTGAAVP
jgi:hypothetical protein